MSTSRSGRHQGGTYAIGTLALQHGSTRLHDVQIAYATHGQLNDDGSNAILVTHGYTSSHHMLAHGEGVAEGSWGGLMGPGRPLDTDRFFIVCSNMLGSSYGSTGPASIDARTGKRYGPDFPRIGVADIVQAQRRLLNRLGVMHLRAVVGPSYGGFQALQWALDHPEMVETIGVILSGPYLPEHEQMHMGGLLAMFEADPAWDGGRYTHPAALQNTLTRLRRDNLRAHGTLAVLAAQGVAPHDRMPELERQARSWAARFDAHSLRVLLQAGLDFDVRPRLHEIQCPVLHVISTTDTLFPPGGACALTGVRDLHYAELDTPFCHQASGAAHEVWAPLLQGLLSRTKAR